MEKSNCLWWAVIFRIFRGGELSWRPGWRKGGLEGFMNNPWGHWLIVLPCGETVSFQPKDKDLPWYKQVWFEGQPMLKGKR